VTELSEGLLRSQSAHLVEAFESKLAEHSLYIQEYLQDMPEIRNWTWSEVWKASSSVAAQASLAKNSRSEGSK